MSSSALVHCKEKKVAFLFQFWGSSQSHSLLSFQENGRRIRGHINDSFEHLVSILEERKQELVGFVAKEQDDKLKHVRSLIRQHGDDLEAAVTLVETAIQSMEEPHMSLFVQVRESWRYNICHFFGFILQVLKSLI